MHRRMGGGNDGEGCPATGNEDYEWRPHDWHNGTIEEVLR